MIDAQEILDRAHTGPRTALILGSGLGGLADAVESAVEIPTSEVQGYPQSTVSGHHGRLILGTLEDEAVLVIQGRAHLYEGHSVRAVSFPVRLAHALGCERLLVTNAAGGIHPNLRPGTLMFITDHLNFVGAHPLVGSEAIANGQAGLPEVRSRSHASPYDIGWIDLAERCAIELQIRTARGVYLWTHGPSYETRSEIAAFRRLGADAVGMSTVPEVIQAGALGMPVLGVSTITNKAAGLSEEALSHEDVLKVGKRAATDLERLVRRLLTDQHRPS